MRCSKACADSANSADGSTPALDGAPRAPLKRLYRSGLGRGLAGVFDERAGIREFDGVMAREEAEAAGYEDTVAALGPAPERQP